METINKTRLFNASCVALVVTALAFATRGSFVEAWATEFNLTHTQVGWIVGTAFWGFTLAMVFGGPLVDIIGIGTNNCNCIFLSCCWYYSYHYCNRILVTLHFDTIDRNCKRKCGGSL